jgi:hypothetical protein
LAQIKAHQPGLSFRELAQEDRNDLLLSFPPETLFIDPFDHHNLLFQLGMCWCRIKDQLAEGCYLSYDQVAAFRGQVLRSFPRGGTDIIFARSCNPHAPDREEISEEVIAEIGDHAIALLSWGVYFIEQRRRLLNLLNIAVSRGDQLWCWI